MATTSRDGAPISAPNGAAMAAVAAAGVGAFAMGATVLAGEMGLFTAPTLYGPAGGVSGRTTLAVVVWLATWGALHARWRLREIQPAPTLRVTLVLIAIGLIATFPPFWQLL